MGLLLILGNKVQILTSFFHPLKWRGTTNFHGDFSFFIKHILGSLLFLKTYIHTYMIYPSVILWLHVVRCEFSHLNIFIPSTRWIVRVRLPRVGMVTILLLLLGHQGRYDPTLEENLLHVVPRVVANQHSVQAHHDQLQTSQRKHAVGERSTA